MAVIYALIPFGVLFVWLVGLIFARYSTKDEPRRRARTVKIALLWPIFPLLACCWPIVGMYQGRKHSREVEERRENLRLTSRSVVRKQWADEDFEKMRKKGAVIGVRAIDLERGEQSSRSDRSQQQEALRRPQASLENTAASPRPVHPGPKMTQFASLPTELRMEIYANLDYGSALVLSRVCRYFRNDTPTEALDREQRATYVYHAETFQQNRHRLACFGCLRVLHRTAFDEQQRIGEFARFGFLEFERMCFECEVKAGRFERPKIGRLFLRMKAWKDSRSLSADERLDRRVNGNKQASRGGVLSMWS